MQVDRPHVQRQPEHRVEQDHSGDRERGLGGVVDREGRSQGEDDRRDERHGVLHSRRGAEVDVGAKALLVNPARSQADERDEQEHYRRVDAALGDQPTRARREHGCDAEYQGDDPHRAQSVTQERRGQQRGGHRVHRDDHRAQHRGSAELDRVVQRAELDGLHQQPDHRDVAELASFRETDPGDARPCAEDDGGESEPDCEHRHRSHANDGQVADRVAQCVEEGHRRRGSDRHTGRRHEAMVAVACDAVQRILAITNDRDS